MKRESERERKKEGERVQRKKLLSRAFRARSTHTATLLVGTIVRTIGASIAAMYYRYTAKIATGEFALGARVAQTWHNCAAQRGKREEH